MVMHMQMVGAAAMELLPLLLQQTMSLWNQQ
jgi:hypothetical protein